MKKQDFLDRAPRPRTYPPGSRALDSSVQISAEGGPVQRLEAGAGWTGVLLPALERWRLHRNDDHEVLRRDDGRDPAQPTGTFKVSYNMLCKLRVGLWSPGDS